MRRLLTRCVVSLRCAVAVRSFAPLVAAVDARYYGRVAAAPFSMAPDALSRFDTHFTVGFYAAEAAAAAAASSGVDGSRAAASADEDAGALPPLLGRAALEAAAAAEGWDWPATDAALRAALASLFAAAGDTIGTFPAGRALYGCDILFEAPHASADGAALLTLQPRLLEVNFCGDLATLLTRVPGGAPEFVSDVMAYLFTDGGALPAGSSLQPL
jgi:hypothetical protein